MDLMGFIIVYFTVALAVFWIHGIASVGGQYDSVFYAYHLWRDAQNNNKGDLQGAQNERKSALHFLYVIWWWSRALVWPLILPVFLFAAVFRAAGGLNDLVRSIVSPKGSR